MYSSENVWNAQNRASCLIYLFSLVEICFQMISLNPALTSKVRMPRINKHSDYYLRKQVVITLSPLCRSCHSPTILTKKTTMPKGEVQYIFHCYFSFAFFLQLVAFRCRNALIAASDWLVLPILDAVFSLFSLSRFSPGACVMPWEFREESKPVV